MQINILNLCLKFALIYQSITLSYATLTFELVSAIPGEIEAGNYSHYTLHENGDFKLVLQTLKGDADLYVTDKHRLADFSNYDWQSITYGIDEVFVTDEMKRPIAISIYAHPYYSKSSYVLNVYSIKSDEKNYETHCRESNKEYKEFYYNSMLKEKSEKTNSNSDFDTLQDNVDLNLEETDEENESIFWAIFINLLKLIAEIIL